MKERVTPRLEEKFHELVFFLKREATCAMNIFGVPYELRKYVLLTSFGVLQAHMEMETIRLQRTTDTYEQN
jgi:hypothetical protein